MIENFTLEVGGFDGDCQNTRAEVLINDLIHQSHLEAMRTV